jgi:acyl carrier protein
MARSKREIPHYYLQLDIDSMDFLNVIVAIHEQTGAEIPERDYPKLSTLNDAVRYLAAARA